MADKISEKVIVTSICKPSLKVSSFMARYFLEFGGKCNTRIRPQKEEMTELSLLAVGMALHQQTDRPTETDRRICLTWPESKSGSEGAPAASWRFLEAGIGFPGCGGGGRPPRNRR